jgi:hypothetical protein
MLEEPSSALQRDVLNIFCQGVISRHSAIWPPEESVLAKELVDGLPALSVLTLDSLRQQCAALGINVSFATLPRELRGYNCGFEGQKEIVISTEQGFPGADEHTLLHEIREILEAAFERLGHPTVNNQDDLEDHAESFAILARAEAIYRMAPTLCNYADNVDRRWMRITVYLFLGLFVCTNLLGCALLPRLEDLYAHDLDRTRNLHT